jgi:heat shock protein HslJ
MVHKNKTKCGRLKKTCIVGILLICGFFLVNCTTGNSCLCVDGQPLATQGSSLAPVGNGANYVKAISGKTWKLSAIQFSDKTVALNRSELKKEEADIFTMTLDSEQVSGKGAPNRYFSMYNAGENNALTIQRVASTMMAALSIDPERIQEPDYLTYLGNVKSWRMNQKKLELVSADANNKEIVLVYVN